MAKVKQRTLPPIHFTKEGYEKVKRDYDELTEKRKGAVDRVKTAREYGDLSENAAYHEARKNLFDIDRRLRHLKMQIIYGKVIESDTDTVNVGTIVTVNQGNTTLNFTIVGEFEADPSSMKISLKSPIGQALLGKKAGDNVTIQVPAGIITYTIKAIEKDI